MLRTILGIVLGDSKKTEIKSGNYAKVNGKEYKLTKMMGTKEYRIIAENEKDRDASFVDLFGTGVYSKKIREKDIKKKYRITTYGIYKGYKLAVRAYNGTEVSVATSDRDIATKLKLDRTDKYLYEKLVPKDKVKLIYEKQYYK